MSFSLAHFSSTNKILSSVPSHEFLVVRPMASRVRLVARQSLIESGQRPEHVFFIEEGIASLLAEADPAGPGVQVAMIGREGMVGSLAVLGHAVAYGSVAVQVPGAALRMSVENLLKCFETCPQLRAACWEYVQSLTRQIMSTAASNASNTLLERFMRWLLMTHDRSDGHDLIITHEALSVILGVRRSGVTTATSLLEERGLIQARRGRIRIVDRPGLEAAAAGNGGQRQAGGKCPTDPGTDTAGAMA